MGVFTTLIFIVCAGIVILVVSMFAIAIYNSIAEKIYNDSQPALTKAVKITGKRGETSGGRGNRSVSTSYYATFEFTEDRKRLELEVPPEDYGLMAEGDFGELTFQGRRYHQFQRDL